MRKSTWALNIIIRIKSLLEGVEDKAKLSLPEMGAKR